MAKDMAQSPLERNNMTSLDQKLAMAKHCSHGNVCSHLLSLLPIFIIVSLWHHKSLLFFVCPEGVVAGAKAAAVATIATAIPTVSHLLLTPSSSFQSKHYNFISIFVMI